jgi:hypothetical protein
MVKIRCSELSYNWSFHIEAPVTFNGVKVGEKRVLSIAAFPGRGCRQRHCAYSNIPKSFLVFVRIAFDIKALLSL